MAERDGEPVRLDKWLWAARFYKTRTLASEEIAKGRVAVNDAPAKAARELHVGDRVEVRRDGSVRIVVVRALSHVRGPAPVAQALYEETRESVAARQRAAEQRRYGVEPGETHADGRPTKRDRRQLADWQRWSASVDDA